MKSDAVLLANCMTVLEMGLVKLVAPRLSF